MSHQRNHVESEKLFQVLLQVEHSDNLQHLNKSVRVVFSIQPV